MAYANMIKVGIIDPTRRPRGAAEHRVRGEIAADCRAQIAEIPSNKMNEVPGEILLAHVDLRAFHGTSYFTCGMILASY